MAPGLIEDVSRVDFSSVGVVEGALKRLVAEQSLDGSLSAAEVSAVFGVEGA